LRGEIELDGKLGMKKILVFSSVGGGGHVSTVQLLRSLLGNDSYIKDVETFQDVLRPVFLIDRFWGGKYGVLKIYNYLLQKNKPFFCNLYLTIGKWYMRLRKKTMKATFQRYIVCEQPDLIISLVPHINFYLLQAAQDLDIPILIMPCDIDIGAYTYIADFKPFSYEKAYITMHFHNEDVHKELVNIGFQPENITVIGAPVRHSFIESQAKNKEELRKKWQVTTAEPIILLMMGAQGSQSVVSYCRELAHVKTPIHVFVCVGKNESLEDSIVAITLPSNVHIHVVGFTEFIDELMAIADIFITKTGGLSVCEGLYTSTPMLLDATSTPLDWERYNYDFVVRHGFGELVLDVNKLASRIDYLLAHSELLDIMRRNMDRFTKKNSQKAIPALISRILTK